MASLKAIGAKWMPSDLVDFELDEGLAAVAVFDDYIKASEAGLAILAMGEAYWTVFADVGHLDTWEWHRCAGTHQAYEDGAVFDDELLDDYLRGGTVFCWRRFCSLGCVLICTAREGVNICHQRFNVGAHQRLFIANFRLLDDDLVNDDLIAKDGTSIDIDLDLAEGEDIFALISIWISDV